MSATARQNVESGVPRGGSAPPCSTSSPMLPPRPDAAAPHIHTPCPVSSQALASAVMDRGGIGRRSCVDSRQVLAVYQALRAKRLRGYAELDGLTLIIILGGIAACAFAVLAHVQADDRARARLAETQACACWEAEPITLGTTSDDGAAGLLLSPRAVSAAPSSNSLEVQP